MEVLYSHHSSKLASYQTAIQQIHLLRSSKQTTISLINPKISNHLFRKPNFLSITKTKINSLRIIIFFLRMPNCSRMHIPINFTQMQLKTKLLIIIISMNYTKELLNKKQVTINFSDICNLCMNRILDIVTNVI